MTEKQCSLNFGEVNNEEVQEYLTSKCQNIIEAHECLVEAKKKYNEKIQIIVNNEDLILKLPVWTDYFNATKEIKLAFDSVEDSGDLDKIFKSFEVYYEDRDKDKIRKVSASGHLKNIVAKIKENDDSDEKETYEDIKKAAEEASLILRDRATINCAQTLKNIAKELAEIIEDEIPEGPIDKVLDFLGFGPDEEEIRQLRDQLEPGNLGAGIGIVLIPQNFREQCIFLAQIFQFIDYRKRTTEDASVSQFEFGTKPDPKKLEHFIRSQKKLPYVGHDLNSSLILDGNPFGFINKLTQYDSMSNYFDATNAQLAHLQPMIRLFKVESNKGCEGQKEFAFDTFARKEDVENIFSKKGKRGFGVGIDKFSFTLHGSNPFAIKKSIKANLVIEANNFSELLEDRNGLRYIDLALKTGSADKSKNKNKKLDKSELNFRIKAVVGLSVPNGNTTSNFDAIEEAVKQNFMTLNLTPVTHTFDFKETGAVTFSIEYYAYIEEYFDKPIMNIFSKKEINERNIERKLAIKTQKMACKDKDGIDNLNQFLKKDAEKIKADKIASLQFITSGLLDKGLIYNFSLDKNQFKELIRNGPFYEFDGIQGNVEVITKGSEISDDLKEKYKNEFTESLSEKDQKSIENSFSISGIENRNFAFFYLGDLVDFILEELSKNLGSIEIGNNYEGLDIESTFKEEQQNILNDSVEQFKKFRFVLGPLEIINHKNKSQSKLISFADLPISLSYFNEWLTSKLLQTDRTQYPLITFLNDLMNDLVKNFLNDDSCYNFNIKQKTRLFQSVITAYGRQELNDDITNYLFDNDSFRLNVDNNGMEKPILATGGHRDFAVSQKCPNKEFHYFVFYAGRVQPKELMTGDQKTDHDNGIFHYVLGKDRGIVKTITLDKTDSPDSLRMVRFEQEGYDGLTQLREIYDVNVRTFCNLGTYPGTYIFVDPRGFSPHLGSFDLDKFDLTDLGIGGYHMIIESTHEFSAGVMDSSFRAKWVQSIENEERLAEIEESGTTGDGSITTKCFSGA